jgi:hypothetical protein
MAEHAKKPGQELERFREYLCLLARLQLDRRLRGLRKFLELMPSSQGG